MGYSKEWDECYKKNRQINKWPYSEVISIIHRYTTIKKEDKVLELGFGTGPNIMFFNSIGVRYYGIEGSETAVQYARKKFPNIQNNLQIADFTQNLVFKEKFDYIIDRGSLTHNSTKGIKRTVDLIYDQLAEGGIFIGIDWFSNSSDLYNKGERLNGDPNTIINMKEGYAANLGEVNFTDSLHLYEIFSKFQFLMLEHKTTYHEIPTPSYKSAFWDFVIRKK